MAKQKLLRRKELGEFCYYFGQSLEFPKKDRKYYKNPFTKQFQKKFGKSYKNKNENHSRINLKIKFLHIINVIKKIIMLINILKITLKRKLKRYYQKLIIMR